MGFVRPRRTAIGGSREFLALLKVHRKLRRVRPGLVGLYNTNNNSKGNNNSSTNHINSNAIIILMATVIRRRRRIITIIIITIILAMVIEIVIAIAEVHASGSSPRHVHACCFPFCRSLG